MEPGEHMVDLTVRGRAFGPARVSRHLGLHRISWLRRPGLALMRAIAKIDITIRHHWAPEFRVHLNLFRHKTYWYHGRNREHSVMDVFTRLIKPGDTVIDLGAHIGYTSLYLAHLVGPTGRLFAFEPQASSLRYLERNAASVPQIEIVPKAASDQTGQTDFFVDEDTGENSTIVPTEFEHVFAANREKAYSDERYHRTKVETVALDDFIASRGIRPDFVKIDIEGAELLALRGMSRTLAEYKPGLMVEVTCDPEGVTRLLADLGYREYTPRLKPWPDPNYNGRNRFYLQRGAI